MPQTRSWKDTLGKPEFTQTIARAEGQRTTVETKLARLLVAISLVAIIFCGLFPFDFTFRNAAGTIRHRFDWTFGQYFTSGDTPENILFFMPLGFALGAVFVRRRGHEIIALILAVLIGAAVSVGIEVLQALLGERDPSVTDVANNTIGALLGCGAYAFVGRRALRIAAGWIEETERKFGPGMLGAITGFFALAICVVPLIMGAESGSLADWVGTYSMAMGNEIGDKRLWFGAISDLTIASRAADPQQLYDLFANRDPADVFGNALVAQYNLRGEPPFIDRAAHLPPLDLARKIATQPSRFARRAPAAPIFPVTTARAASPATTRALSPIDPTAPPWEFSEETWLRTPDPVEYVAREVANTNECTVMLTASSARNDQYLVARLVTISAGAWERNLTIGQDGSNLVVRVRTPTTGVNGNGPEFVLRDVFIDPTPRRIIVTFARATLNVFVDNLAWHGEARLTPEAATIWAMYPRDNWKFQLDSNDAERSALIYRAITFLPLGALTAATVNLLRRRARERVTVACVILGATIVLMESLITTLGGQPLSLAHPIASAIAAFIGILIVRIRSDTPWVRTK